MMLKWLVTTKETSFTYSNSGCPMETFFIVAAIWQGAQQSAIAWDAELLGAKKFAIRKAAARLFKAGPAAIPRLEKLVTSAKDPQVGKAAAPIAEKIYVDTIGIDDAKSLPSILRLPLGEFLRYAERCRKEAEKGGIKVQLLGSRGESYQYLATLFYLRHLVRNG